MSLFVTVGALIDGGAGLDAGAGGGKQEEEAGIGDSATSESVSPVGLESPFGRVDIEEGGVKFPSGPEEESDDVEEDEDESGDGEGTPKV